MLPLVGFLYCVAIHVQTYPQPMVPIAVEEPTVRMTFGVNKSPLAGREGKFLTTRMIRDRLMKELDRNVALRVEETDSSDVYEVRDGKWATALPKMIFFPLRAHVFTSDITTALSGGLLLAGFPCYPGITTNSWPAHA